MRKKVLISFIAMIMAFSMVGCNQNGAMLLNDLYKIYSWEHREQETDITISINNEYTDLDITVGVYTYLQDNDEDFKLQLKAYLKSVRNKNTVVDLTSEKDNIIPFELYVENGKVCVGTEILREYLSLYLLTNEMLEYDYIGMDISSYMESAGVTIQDIMGNPEKELQGLLSSNIDIPVSKDGKTYTLQLDAEQMLNLYECLAIQSIKLQKDTILNLAFSEDEMKETIETIEAGIPEEDKVELLETIGGTTADIKITSESESVNASAAINVVVNDVYYDVNGNFVKEDQSDESIKININSTVKKVQPKEFTFPSEAKMYKVEDMLPQEDKNDYDDDYYDDDYYDDDWDGDNDYDDDYYDDDWDDDYYDDYYNYDDDYYEEPYAGYWGTLPVNKADMKIIEGDICFPAKTTLEKAGLTLIYDELQGDMKIKELPNTRLYLRTIDGVSYISIYELNEVGIYYIRVVE